MNFRNLSQKEEQDFRVWAREHQSPEDVQKAKDGVYHPVVLDEYRVIGLIPTDIGHSEFKVDIKVTGYSKDLKEIHSEEYTNKDEYILVIKEKEGLIVNAQARPDLLLNTIDVLFDRLSALGKEQPIIDIMLMAKLAEIGRKLADGAMGTKH